MAFGISPSNSHIASSAAAAAAVSYNNMAPYPSSELIGPIAQSALGSTEEIPSHLRSMAEKVQHNKDKLTLNDFAKHQLNKEFHLPNGECKLYDYSVNPIDIRNSMLTAFILTDNNQHAEWVDQFMREDSIYISNASSITVGKDAIREMFLPKIKLVEPMRYEFDAVMTEANVTSLGARNIFPIASTDQSEEFFNSTYLVWKLREENDPDRTPTNLYYIHAAVDVIDDKVGGVRIIEAVIEDAAHKGTAWKSFLSGSVAMVKGALNNFRRKPAVESQTAAAAVAEHKEHGPNHPFLGKKF